MYRKNNHIRLWEKGVSLLCITALAAFCLSGCTLKSAYQKEEEKEQGELDIYQKIELTEKEMEQTHFTIGFREKVKIDAGITPYHMYKDGVGTYYNEHGGRVWNPDINLVKLDKKAKDAKLKDLAYFGKPAEEIPKLIEVGAGRKPQTKKMHWKYYKKHGLHEVTVPFTKEGNEDDVVLTMRWDCPADEDDNPLPGRKKLYCYYFNMRNEAGVQVQNLVNRIQYEHMASDTEKNLSFADSGETAQMLKEMLTKLTGYQYSEDYEVIPIDTDVIESAVKEAGQRQQKMDIRDAGYGSLKPCYYYRFYQELDGLAVRSSQDAIQADEKTNLSKELREEIKDKDTTYCPAQIDHYCFPYVEIIYDDTGIIYLNIDNNFVPDAEPAGEREPVINLSDLLEPLYEHFDSVISIDTTVYEIRLGYRATFTDGKDGPIRRILLPVWIVKYDTQIEGKRSEVICFDGYTGTPLKYINVT